MFAELIQGLVDWQRNLEGWNVRESQLVLEWQREARMEAEVRTKRMDLLEVLRARFPAGLPEEVRLAIDGTNDLTILARWLIVAATASSLADFRKAMNSP
jgi:hypothetical protein